MAKQTEHINNGSRALVIVDPQIDFITGVLSVPGAEEAMNDLARYIREDGSRYNLIIVTADRHPANHCSFSDNGGRWPRHCVHDSVGAAVWPPIMDALYDFTGTVVFLHKGESADIEEYSIFKNATAATQIDSLIEGCGVKQIDICGLAGDICVCCTAEDAAKRYGRKMINILNRYSPSLDGGETLAYF